MKRFVERYGIHGAAAGIAGLLGFLLAEFLSAEIKLSKAAALTFVCLSIYVFLVFAYEYALVKNQTSFKSPRLLKVISEGEDVIFVFAKSSWVAMSFIYSAFYILDNIEFLVTSGVVINIQSNLLIQIRMGAPSTYGGPRSVELMEKLKVGGADDLEKVILKPGVVQNV